MIETKPLDSPCIQVCVLDAATQMCIGCHRTIDEIAGWSNYSKAERDIVYGKLVARRALVNHDERTAGEN